MNYWSFQQPLEIAARLAAPRRSEDWEVLVSGQTLWVRHGTNTIDHHERNDWPVAERWTVVEGNRLCRLGERVPSRSVPVGEWIALSEWLAIHQSPSVWPGEQTARAGLTLDRASALRPVHVLRTTWNDWYRYAESAPNVRLAHLSFAVNAHGATLIHGTPLPPIRGEAFTLDEGILCPAGWAFHPPVDALTIRRSIVGSADESNDLFLWDRSESAFLRIPEESFVPATRAAVRATDSQSSALGSNHEAPPAHGGPSP